MRGRRVLAVLALVLAAAGAAAAEPVPVPEPTELAVRWYRSGVALWLAGTLFAIALPFAIFASGLSARLRDFATAGGRRGLFAASAIFAAGFVALSGLLELPWSWYVSFARPHAYGVSTQSLAKWTTDVAIETVLLAGIAALLLWLPIALVRRFPRRWWLACAGLSVPLATLLLLVHPVWVAPLFNDFGAMRDHALEARILALADTAGIEGSRVFEVNKSVDTRMMNAYVSGFGGTKRIVLWDTLTAKLTPDEALAVMAHEMGHYVLQHILLAIAFTPLFVGTALWAVQRAAPPLLRRFAARTGVRDLGDLAAVPLAVALLQVATFALNPFACAVSRHVEHEADRFALELTRDNESVARAFVALQTTNLGHPRPDRWVVWLRYTHPPLGDRIDFANTYRPWETGEPLRYADRFAPQSASRRDQRESVRSSGR